MIDKRVIIIVGAGGSVPYGFPTGEKLKWAICDILNKVERKDGSAPGSLAGSLVHEGFSIGEMAKLRDNLKRSGWSSIDEFLTEHKDLQLVGKAAIAGILLRSENRGLLSDPRDANDSRVGSWYQQLFKTVFYPFGDIQRNTVTILTYNYDTSLETYLQDAMNASYSYRPEQIKGALDHVPIVHLHGKLSDHEYGHDPGVSLRRCAEGIHIMTEDIDNVPQFKQAANALWEANEIYFVGFGYDENNLKRLPIESKYPPYSSGARTGEPRPSLNVSGTAFGVAPGTRKWVEGYFEKKGFKMTLGADTQNAFEFLQSTLRFGVG